MVRLLPITTTLSLILLSVLSAVVYGQQLGDQQQTVAWRAGHAAAYIDPYVIVYGGTEDIDADANSNSLTGSTSLWVWDSRNGAWYHPVQLDGAASPQVNFRATPIPSPGQMLAVLSNTSMTGPLQKLDTNSWTWSFPTASLPPSNNVVGYALDVVNNTMYMYGGLTVDQTGFPITNAVSNNLYTMDANAYTWSQGSNGLGVTDHTMCYIPHANALISFGGTTTGSRANPIQNVFTYDLGQHVWNMQVTVQSVNAGVPGARRLHTANCLEDRMIIYGGGTDRPFDSDVWILDASNYPTLTWQKPAMQNLAQGPNVRMGHTSVLDSATKKIYIYGGWGANDDTNMYILDYQNWAWTRVTPEGFSNNNAAEPTPSPNDDGSNTNQPTDGDTNGNGNKTAIIVGSAVGGAAAIALVAAALFLFCCIRRRRRERRKAQEEEEEEAMRNVPKDEKTFRDMTSGSNYRHDDNGDNNNKGSTTMPDSESKVMLQQHPSSKSQPTTLGSRSSSGAAIPSLMLSELGTTGTSTNTRSSSPIQGTAAGYQTPNEIHTQKPNEFTRPLQQRSITSSMLASTGISPSSPSDQYTYTTTFRSSVSSNVPLAQIASPQQHPLSPSSTSSNTTSGGAAATAAMTIPVDIYESVSPLEMLATLGRLDEEQDDQEQRLLPSRYTMLPRQPIRGHANSIYFAMDGANTPVVVKSFGRREAWERECRALNKLKSNHVVQVFEVLNNDTTHLAVLENLDESLQTIMRQQPSLLLFDDDLSIRRKIAKEITASLAYAHSRDIAFCDLKPSNIMRSRQGDWKLIDFEASRTIGQECVGLITPRYCPPEVARATTYGHEGAKGVVATASVDLWSLGCVIYELETRHHEPLFAQTITDDTVLHFVSHPSPLTPALSNGLRWNEQVELDIPDFERRIADPNAQSLIKALLSRDPIKRGSASYWMKTHPYFCT